MARRQETHDDRVAYGEAVGRGFIDKLLLAIIDAYPEPTTSHASEAKRRIDRLRDAKRALFGQAHPEGRPEVSDERVMRWIGAQHYIDLGKGEKIRSDRELVRQALTNFALPENSDERLRKKLSRQKQKWLEIAKLHDDVPEQIEHSLLKKVQRTLSREGIEMRLDRIER